MDPSWAQEDHKVATHAIFLDIFLELELQRGKRRRDNLLFEESDQLLLVVLRDLDAEVVWKAKINDLTLIIVLHFDALDEVFAIKEKKFVLLHLAPDQFLNSEALLDWLEHFFQKPAIIGPHIEQDNLDLCVCGPFLLKQNDTPR